VTGLPPAAPYGVVATESPGGLVTVTFAHDAPEGLLFRVERSVAGVAEVVSIEPGLEAQDGSAPLGLELQYVVTAIDAHGRESAPSEPFTLLLDPAAGVPAPILLVPTRAGEPAVVETLQPVVGGLALPGQDVQLWIGSEVVARARAGVGG